MERELILAIKIGVQFKNVEYLTSENLNTVPAKNPQCLIQNELYKIYIIIWMNIHTFICDVWNTNERQVENLLPRDGYVIICTIYIILIGGCKRQLISMYIFWISFEVNNMLYVLTEEKDQCIKAPGSGKFKRDQRTFASVEITKRVCTSYGKKNCKPFWYMKNTQIE